MWVKTAPTACSLTVYSSVLVYIYIYTRYIYIYTSTPLYPPFKVNGGGKRRRQSHVGRSTKISWYHCIPRDAEACAWSVSLVVVLPRSGVDPQPYMRFVFFHPNQSGIPGAILGIDSRDPERANTWDPGTRCVQLPRVPVLMCYSVLLLTLKRENHVECRLLINKPALLN